MSAAKPTATAAVTTSETRLTVVPEWGSAEHLALLPRTLKGLGITPGRAVALHSVSQMSGGLEHKLGGVRGFRETCSGHILHESYGVLVGINATDPGEPDLSDCDFSVLVHHGGETRSIGFICPDGRFVDAVDMVETDAELSLGLGLEH